MNRHTLALVLALLTLLTASPLAFAQDEATPADDPLLRLLRFIPDTPATRQWVTFGDAAAWHTSWGVPRIDSKAELDALDREPRAYWLFIMPRQTVPPDPLGIQYLFAEDFRGAYGFDFFNLDRYLLAGQPPDWITVAESSFDQAQVADALAAAGYTSEALEPEGALFSLMDDYAVDVSADLPTPGKLGNLNRVALFDGQLVLAKATGVVNGALEARSGAIPSLADNPAYVAAAAAINDPALGDLGELVGVILADGSQFWVSPTDPLSLAPGASEDEIARLADELRKRLDQESAAAPLPLYTLAAFATRHTEGASHLILALIFPPGVDASAAAEILADRMQHYVSLVTDQPLDDRWAFEAAMGVEAEGLPAALVVMRAGDPPPTPEDAEQVQAGVFSWANLVYARDTGFLALIPE